MGFTTDYYTAEQHYLYDGGIQAEEAEKCYICGDTIRDPDDGTEIGEHVCCNRCYREMRKYYQDFLKRVFAEPVEKEVLIEALEDYLDVL